MAYTKKTKKSVKKKVYKRKAKPAPAKGMSLVNTYQKNMVDFGRGLPKMAKVEHIYSESTSVTSTGGTAYYTFSANNMFDPNYTSAGHQPLYRDELQALYSKSCVIGSRIDVLITPIATSYNTVPINLNLFVHDTAVPSYPDPVTSIEQPDSNYRLLAANVNQLLRLSSKWSAKRMFGKGVLANNALQGESGSGPTEQSYFSVAIRPTDNLTTVSVQIVVKLSYICIWKELRNVSQS